MIEHSADVATTIAQKHYESDNAHQFYQQVWGGEYSHVGLYDELSEEDVKLDNLPRLAKACTLATEELLRRCFPPGGPAPETCTLMDLGSGNGGIARLAARRFGCKVICINIASRENAINRELSKAADLEDKIIIPGERSFFDTQVPDASVDVVYSVDAFMHAGSERRRVIAEAERVLKPGGFFIVSDVMQRDDATYEQMKSVMAQIQADSLSSVQEYKQVGKDAGLKLLDYTEKTHNMITHYQMIYDILLERREKGELKGIEDAWIVRCAQGLFNWNSASSQDLLRWGFFSFEKPAEEMPDKTKLATDLAKDYYESDNAQNFYKEVFGGNWIHVGQYTDLSGEDTKLEGASRLSRACALGTQQLLRRCFPSDGPAPETCTAMDFGSGVGGAARMAAKDYGCKVICINVTARENAINIELSKAAGLSDKVIVPGERSFFETGFPNGTIDVVFSQDSILHAECGRFLIFKEASRLLKTGGLFAFTDLMMAEDTDPKDMKVALDRLYVKSMGTPNTYEKWGKECGLDMVEYTELTENMKTHYKLIEDILVSKRGQSSSMDEAFIESSARGLAAWNDVAGRDLMRWGYMVFKKQ